MNEDTSNLILGIILLLVLIFGGFFIAYYYKLLPSKLFEKSETKIDETYFDMNLVCPEGSKFILKYKNLNYVSGEIYKDSVEIVKNVSSSREYVLHCLNDDYYYGMQICSNQTICEVKLEKKAKIDVEFEVFSNNIDYKIYVKDGLVKDAVLCVGWENIVGLSSHSEEIPIIYRMLSYSDKCYGLGDLRDNLTMTFEYVDASNNAKVNFYLIDRCVESIDTANIVEDYGDCGLKDYVGVLRI